MKFKFIVSLCLAGASLGLCAQTHVEGVEYYKADQFNNALELLERNFNNPGTDKGIANYYLGLLAIKQNNYAQAQKYFEAGIAANSEYPYNYIGIGSLELKNGQLKEAEENFKKAEKLNKKDAAVEVAIARAYYESGDDAAVKYAKEIAKYMKKAEKRDLYEPEIFIFQGDVAYDSDDVNTAAQKYDMATTYNPKAADAYVKYANLFKKLNPQYSIEELKKLLLNNPTSALGQRELANIYYDIQDYKNAAIQYGSYVNNPNHFKSDESRYALLLFFDQDYKTGYEYASKLLAEDSTDFVAQRFQFMNAAQLDEMNDQLISMAQKLYADHKADPKNRVLSIVDYNLLAMCYGKNKEYDIVKQILEDGMKNHQQNKDFIRQLAYNYIDKSDFANAAQEMENYVNSIDDETATDLLNVAMFNYYAGVTIHGENAEAAAKHYAKATEYANKSIAADSSNYRAYKLLGDVKIQQSTKENITTVAREDYQNALQRIDAAKYPGDYEKLNNYLNASKQDN